jgi:hypothetical protein
VPGCLASRMRTMLDSAAKVAKRWASCGEAARRRRGGDAGNPAADDLVGDDGTAAVDEFVRVAS